MRPLLFIPTVAGWRAAARHPAQWKNPSSPAGLIPGTPQKESGAAENQPPREKPKEVSWLLLFLQVMGEVGDVEGTQADRGVIAVAAAIEPVVSVGNRVE